MKKKMLIIIIAIVFISIAGIIVVKSMNNNKPVDNTIQPLSAKNISGQYSELRVNDFDSAKDSLKNILEELNVDSIENELEEDMIDTSGNYINTYKLKQLYNGIKVHNGGLIIYTDKNGITKGIVNNLKDINNLDVTPKSSLNTLESIIKNEYNNIYIDSKNFGLIVYQLENGDFTLAHKYITFLNDEFINNETIIIEDGTNKILSKSNITYNLEKSDYEYFLVDDKYDLADLKRKIFLVKQDNGKIDEKNTENTETYSWNKNEEISSESELLTQAICTTQKCHDYYENKFNYTFSDTNANNNGVKLITNVKKYYGDNISNTILSVPSASVIVIGADNKYNDNVECLGHEYTHCVFYNKTGNEGNSSLENEALNEAYADIMGMCMEAYYNGNTSIDGYISSANSRDIKNSQAKYQELNNWIKKDKYYYSMIVSKTAYLMNQDISLDKLENLWFESMKLLGKGAKFHDCYYAITETAKIIGFSDNEINIIKDAFLEVGINSNALDELIISADKIWKNDKNNIISNSDNKTEENTVDLFDDEELQIGSKTIKCGTYDGIFGATGDILVIKSDKTATLNGKEYTYKVGKYNFAQDSSRDSYKDAIIFLNTTGDTAFALYVGNDGSLRNDPMEYVYSEN